MKIFKKSLIKTKKQLQRMKIASASDIFGICHKEKENRIVVV
jgi:hypothetical protein